MPRELAVLAIAHELAHISYFLEAETNHWRITDAGPRVYNACERLVDDRLLIWGFAKTGLETLNKWLGDHGIQRFEKE